MNMLDLMNKMTQLSEAKEKTKTGLKHTAEPGGYGRKDDEDDEGNKVKATAVKKGKGRPKKDADDSGETKKYDFSAFGVKSGKDVKLPKHDKKKTTVVKGKSQSHADNKKDDGTDPETKSKKKGLKEYFDSLDKALNENEISSNRIANMNKPNQEFHGKNPHFARGTEVKDIGKTVDASGKPISALATKVTPKFNKPGQVQRIARGSFNSPVEESDYTTAPMPGAVQVKDATGKVVATAKSPQAAEMFKKGDVTLGNPEEMHEEDIGKHNNATTGFDALVRKLTPKYGVEAAKRIAGAQMKKIKEADQPPNDSLMSPMSEARAKADDKAEKAGKKVTKDLEYDMRHKGKDDNKAEKAGKKVTKDIEYDEKKKLPSMAHIKKMCQDGKSVAEICKMHPDCDQKELKQMVADCKETLDEASMPMKKVNGKSVPAFAADGKGKNDLTKKKVKEGMEHKLKAAYHAGKAHGLTGGSHCGKNYEDMEEARQYHEGYKCGLDECYGQMPIQGYVGEATSHAADADEVLTRWVSSLNPMSSHRIDKEIQILGANDSRTGGPELYNAIKQAVMTNPKWKNSEIGKYVSNKMLDETTVVGNMASYGAEEGELAEADIEESPFSWAAKNTPKGSKFSLGGKEFVKNDAFAFEALDKQLNALLEDKEVTEGMTVSISKGQQGTPDSVSVSAQDSEADQLLSIIKQSGLGLFGGDDAGQPQTNQPMTVDGGEGPQANIEVVDDHDDMLSLIRKMTGQGPAQASGDYEEEGGEEMHGHVHGEEETCESCGGMMEEGHACGEAVEEDESMDQREYEVAEEINPNNNDEAEEEQTDSTRDAALAQAAGKNFADTDAPLEEGGDGGEASDSGAEGVDIADVADETEEDLEESLANGADDTFESDIDFMTKVISGGLNRQKSTGQTTIPVVSTQINRLGSPMRESTDLLTDWRKLSGIK